MTSAIAAANLSRPSAPVRSSDAELQQTFQQAVAGMIFGEMMKAMRSTVGEPAYIHGGQAEQMFQQQMDQHLIEDLADKQGSAFVGDLYRQFRVQLGLPVATPGTAAATAEQGHFTVGPAQSRFAARAEPPQFVSRETRVSGSTETARLSSPEIDGVNSPQTPQPAISPPSPITQQSVASLESLQQARSAADATPGATGLSGLTALFRK